MPLCGALCGGYLFMPSRQRTDAGRQIVGIPHEGDIEAASSEA